VVESAFKMNRDLSSYEPASFESQSSPFVSGASSEFKGGLGPTLGGVSGGEHGKDGV